MPSGVYIRTEEHNKNMSLVRKGKTYEELYGKEKAKETKRKMSLINNSGRFKKGHKHSEESKIKMSEARKGIKLSKETKLKMSLSHMGEIKSKETKLKMGLARKNMFKEGKLKIGIKGKSLWNKGWPSKKQPKWLGEIYFKPYEIEFNKQLKEFIRKRDNYRCQQCFRHQDELRTKYNRKEKLSIHHIDFNKQNNNPNNLISLCRSCHMQTSFNREEWTDYFQDKIGEI